MSGVLPAGRTRGSWKVTYTGFPSGFIPLNWNDAEKISMAPAQG